ncbi:MAG: carotenoid oxygenase family protein, partial [Pseudomonadota bacterium]|nr:carotenoid oxygenase family protein [Pseudomonadota bacterium]
MAQPFPNHPNLRGGFAPLQMECDVNDLVIEGEIPRALNGSFYRNGPNPQYAPRGHYHWFGGDGMVHAFHVEDGRVAYRNRWVRTIKWQKEREAGRSLFSAFNPLDNDDSVAGLETDGVANTNIIWHGGKLLALEEGHAPFELDPHTLESIGPHIYGGKLKGPMTAHPKIDPENGEMLFFGYNANGTISEHMTFSVVDRDGKLLRSESCETPDSSNVHHILVTRDPLKIPKKTRTRSMER